MNLSRRARTLIVMLRGCLVFVLAMMVGCVEAQLIECADGRACPLGTACDDIHASCVEPAQLAECVGVSQETPCEAGAVVGVCLDEVCLEPGCGNGIVEPGAGEVCDDGGRDAGDGCAPDCRSREVCSDGVLAPGEACDDANLVDHDGCDSRCQLEQAAWTTTPVAPPRGEGGYYGAPGTFDEQRGVLVVPAGPVVWEWDRVRWTLHVPVIPLVVEAAAYDRTAAVVTAIGRNGPDRVLATWDGAEWQLRDATGTPQGYDSLRAVYVDHLASLLVGLYGTAYLVDTATATWTPVGSLPPASGSYVFGYDRVREVVVGISDGYVPCCSDPVLPQTWEWTGGGWTTFPTSPAPYAEQRLVFDGARGQLLSIGGTTTYQASECCDSVNLFATVEGWDGSAWTPVATPTIPEGAYPAAWFDATTGTLGLTAPDGHNYELGTTLVDRTVPQPIGIAQVANDPVRGRVIAVTRRASYFSGLEVWAWTDHWERLTTGPGPAEVSAMAFDPVRGAIVAAETYPYRLWAFDTDWQLLGAGPAGISTMGYDFVGQRMILGTTNMYGAARNWALDSTSVTATPLVFDAGPAGISGQFAWDSSTAQVVALSTAGGLYDLTPDGWAQTLSPGTGYVLVPRLRAGGILLAPLANALVPAWLREGDAWRITPWERVAWGTTTLAAEREDGTTTVFYDGSIVRDLRSAGPGIDETCAAGEDADGDGLTACDDRDCWVTCTPLCPAAMSCAP